MKYRVVHSQDVFDVMRFDGSYHNADANIYDAVIKKHSSHNLSYYCSEIFTSGRNKRVYTRPEFGYPFLSNSDVVSSNPFMSCKYSSKKYGFDETAVLKAGMIVTGRVGAIGQTAFIPAYLEKAKAMGSDNIIRISVKSSERNGYIYAYLASKMGNLSFWKHATGGVQPFITDAMVASIPIPSFPEDFQNKINDLVLESARLREEAASSLNEAHSIIEGILRIRNNKTNNKVAISSIAKDAMIRFEASYYLSEAMSYENLIKTFGYHTLDSICSRIFGGGRARRYYTKDRSRGVPYLSNSDLGKANPLRSCKYSLKSKVDVSSILRKGMIVTGRVGAIGQTQYIGESFEKMQTMGSDNVIRIVPKEHSGFLFAYLSSKVGNCMFWKYATGGVQPFISSEMVGQILVPILPNEIIEKCDALIKNYSDSIELASITEDLAISLVEQEIEKWNK